jgi:hypothetical protein
MAGGGAHGLEERREAGRRAAPPVTALARWPWPARGG